MINLFGGERVMSKATVTTTVGKQKKAAAGCNLASLPE